MNANQKGEINTYELLLCSQCNFRHKNTTSVVLKTQLILYCEMETLLFCYCLLSWKQEFESKVWKLTSHDLCSPKSRCYFVLLLLFSGFCSCLAYLAWWIKSLSCIVEWYYVFHLGFHFVLYTACKITFWELTRSTKCNFDHHLYQGVSYSVVGLMRQIRTYDFQQPI